MCSVRVCIHFIQCISVLFSLCLACENRVGLEARLLDLRQGTTLVTVRFIRVIPCILTTQSAMILTVLFTWAQVFLAQIQLSHYSDF